MKKAENSEKRPEIWRQVFRRMKNQDGASLMAALLFFVFCGVGASIILASASASAGKIRHPVSYTHLTLPTKLEV